MQTSAPGGHSFVIRPSTSPIPSFELSSVRKSSQAKMLNQAAAAARLRPLPHRSSGGNTSITMSAPATGGPVLGGMCISGKQTGEEKVLTAVERREPAAQTKALFNTTPEPKENINHNAQHIRKLEQEVRKLKEIIKTRNGEKETLKEKLGHQDSLLVGCNKRIVDLQQQLHAEQLERSSDKEEAESAIKALKSELANADKARKEQSSGLADVEARYEERLREAEIMHNTFAEQQAFAQQQLRDEFSRWKTMSEGSETRNEELRKEIQSLKEAHARELQSAGAREAKLQAELNEAKAAILERETRLENWKSQISDCNSYIVKICQPSFSVVKDESLTPVSSDEPESGGFVLVPLKLMLEGYQILPGDMKKNIADEYERTKNGSSNGLGSGIAATSTAGRSASISPVEQAPHRPTTSPVPGGYASVRGRKSSQ